MSDFPSFDELLKMAQERPDQLEAFRQKQVNDLISSAPVEYRRRLEGLQFQIDAQRKIHADSPIGACVKISQMMHESFAELRTWLNQVSGNETTLTSEMGLLSDPEEKSNAKVLTFPIG